MLFGIEVVSRTRSSRISIYMCVRVVFWRQAADQLTQTCGFDQAFPARTEAVSLSLIVNLFEDFEK